MSYILKLYENKELASLGFYGTDRLTPPVEGPIIIEDGKVCCIACRSKHKDVHCLRMHMARSH